MQQLFVIGNPRSGTSLLRIMLNSHRSMVIPPECGFIQWWFNKYHNWTSKSSISEFLIDLKTSKKIETWQLDFDGLLDFLELQAPSSYQALVFSIISFYGLSKHKKVNPQVLGDKNNYYIDHLDLLKIITPNAKFIIILRDPRDIYCSYNGIAALVSKSSYIPRLSKNIEGFISDWRSNQTKILNFLGVLDQNQFIIINYEDLIVDSKHELHKVCNFLEITYEEEMLYYYKTNDEPSDLLDWKKKTLQPPDISSIGRYKKLLSTSEIKKIENETFAIYETLKGL